MDIIRARNLHKVYQMGTTSVHALNGINFTVEEGVRLSYGRRDICKRERLVGNDTE